MSYKLRFLVEADKEIPLAKLPEFTMIATAAIGHADGGLLRVPVIDLAHPRPPIDAFALDDDVDGDLYQSSVSEATTD